MDVVLEQRKKVVQNGVTESVLQYNTQTLSREDTTHTPNTHILFL